MEIEMKKTLHEGKKPFQCKMCDNTYSTKGNLKRHYDKIHGKNESNQKSLKVKHSLSDNDEIEKNSKVATIKEVIFCEEFLGQYCYKIDHIPILDLKKCEFNQKFKSQKSIEVKEESNSLSEKHEGKGAVHDEEKHGCPHCDLKFSLVYTLENHIDKKHKENKMCNNGTETEVNLSKEPENEKAPSSTTEATNPSEAFLQTISSDDDETHSKGMI